MFSRLTIALILFRVCGIRTLIHPLSNFHWITTCLSFFCCCRVHLATCPSCQAGLTEVPSATARPHCPQCCCARTPAARHLDPFHVSYRRILLSCKENSGKDKHILVPFLLIFSCVINTYWKRKENTTKAI